MIDGLWEGGRFVLASTIYERERTQAAEIDRLRAALRDLHGALRERHYGRMPEDVQRAYDAASALLSEREGRAVIASDMPDAFCKVCHYPVAWASDCQGKDCPHRKDELSAEARQEGGRTQAGWISVSERLPAVNQSVALLDVNRWENVAGDWDRHIHACGYWGGSYWCVRGERALLPDAFTHWFALPDAARQDEGAGR